MASPMHTAALRTSFSDWRRRHANLEAKRGPSRARLRSCQLHQGLQGTDAQVSAPGWPRRNSRARARPPREPKSSAKVTRSVARPRASAWRVSAESGSQQSSSNPVQPWTLAEAPRQLTVGTAGQAMLWDSARAGRRGRRRTMDKPHLKKGGYGLSTFLDNADMPTSFGQHQ